uniref:Uncharacterized protein n=1 Tax=Quercus lobata TaxID=97700 RepID=A0A7N2N196_QUELO
MEQDILDPEKKGQWWLSTMDNVEEVASTIDKECNFSLFCDFDSGLWIIFMVKLDVGCFNMDAESTDMQLLNLLYSSNGNPFLTNLSEVVGQSGWLLL